MSEQITTQETREEHSLAVKRRAEKNRPWRLDEMDEPARMRTIIQMLRDNKGYWAT